MQHSAALGMARRLFHRSHGRNGTDKMACLLIQDGIRPSSGMDGIKTILSHLCHILRKGPRCIYHQGRINAPSVRMDALDDALLHLHI